MGGDGGGSRPSREERELQQVQADTLREQQAMLRESTRMQELLAPILYDEIGLSPIYEDVENVRFTDTRKRIDEIRSQLDSDKLDGNLGKKIKKKLGKELTTLEDKLSGMTETERKITGFNKANNPADALRKDIEMKLLERTKAALAGELPVDPALMSDLAERERTLEEELSKDFGSLSAARTSSAGIERLNKFSEMKENVLAGARRGDLTFAQQLAQSQGADNLNRFVSTPASVVGLPFNTAGYNGLNQSLSQVIGGYRNDRFMRDQARAQETSDRYGLAGTIIGGAASIGAAAVF